jgi:hypothetical protein
VNACGTSVARGTCANGQSCVNSACVSSNPSVPAGNGATLPLLAVALILGARAALVRRHRR